MYKQSKVDVSMRFVDGVNDPSTLKRRKVAPGQSFADARQHEDDEDDEDVAEIGTHRKESN